MSEERRTGTPAPADRAGAADASAASSAILPINVGQRRAVGLRGLTNDVPDDVLSEGALEIARQYGAADEGAASPARQAPRNRPRPRSPIAPDLEMPHDGEEIPWRGNLRADFPEYALEQLNEFCHRNRCTQVSALLRMMAAFTDREGKPVFFIRREDMVPDRRKAPRRRR